MTKASIKKTWGSIFAGALLVGTGYALFRNIADTEIVKTCLQTLLIASGMYFGLKLGTGLVEAFKTRSGGNSDQ